MKTFLSSLAVLLIGLPGMARAQRTTVTPALVQAFQPIAYPSRLAQDGNGNFYGVERTGGTYGYGSIFRLAPDGTRTALVSFDGKTNGCYPFPLTTGPDGNLYGVTQYGASTFFPGPTYGAGTIFRLTPAGTLTTLVNLNAANVIASVANPAVALTLGPDGNLYGAASGANTGRTGNGAIFRVTPDGNTLTALVSYPPQVSTNPPFPGAPLVPGSDRTLYSFTHYGGTNGYGLVLRVNADRTVTTVFNFNNDADGGYPASLIAGTDGNVYGTCDIGGASQRGTVFEIVGTGPLTTIASQSLDHPSSSLGNYGTNLLVQASNGGALGFIADNFYRLTAGGSPTVLAAKLGNNDFVRAAILAADGNVYASCGNPDVFSTGASVLKITTAGASSLFADVRKGRGQNPEAGLTPDGAGNLYGTTFAGGTANDGTIYKLAADDTLTPVVDFNGTNGQGPKAALTPDGQGNFYGTTSQGGTGSGGSGTVFKLAAKGTLTTLVSFGYTAATSSSFPGDQPETPLVRAGDGYFYGTTRDGGAGNSRHGTIYKVDPNAGSVSSVYELDGPAGNVVAGADGNLYLTCGDDGLDNNNGTFFQYKPADGTLTPLAYFNGTSARSMVSTGVTTIIQGSDGNFYGVSPEGGMAYKGTVFRVTAGGTVFPLVTFDGTNGAYPTGGLIEGTDGNFYGTTATTVFSVTPGGVFTSFFTFATDGTAGSSALGALTQTAAGDFYGVTQNGPANGAGTIYKFNPNPTPTPTPTPTVTPTPTPGTTPTPTPGFTPTPTPGVTPTPTPGVTPTPTPGQAPTPTPTPATPLSLLGLSLTSGGNAGPVTLYVSGNGFVAGTTFTLTLAGKPDLAAGFTAITDGGFTAATVFDLTGHPPGVYNLVAVNPGGTPVTLPNAFAVLAGTGPVVNADIIGRDVLVQGRPSTFTIYLSNSGDADAVAVPVYVTFPSYCQAQPLFEIPEPPQPPDISTPVDFSQIPLTVSSGTNTILPLIVPRIPAGAFKVLQITFIADFPVSTLEGAPFEIDVDAAEPLIAPGTDAINSARAQRGLPPMTTHRLEGVGGSGISAGCLGSLVSAGLDCIPIFLPGVTPFTCAGKCASYLLGATVGAATPGSNSPATKALSTTALVAGSTALVLDCTEKAIPGVGTVLSIIQCSIDFVMVSQNCGSGSGKGKGGKSSGKKRGSLDPNGKFGSDGAGGDAHYLNGSEPLRYQVEFENVATATLPAQRVVVTDQLDTALLDLGSFNLGLINFGNTTLYPPPGVKSYSDTVDLRPASNLLVQVNAGVNASTGLLTCVFQALDPVTGLPPDDPALGFLPPDTNPPAGTGMIFYTIRPKAGLPTGTAIRNSATVFFDQNAPIVTPTWVNTLDGDAPVSKVKKLARTSDKSRVKLKLSGTDVGAGIADYDIYVSEDGGAFEMLLAHQAGPKAIFTATTGHQYGFFARARDAAGNLEPLKNAAEAKIKIVGPDLIGAWNGVTTKTTATGRTKLKGSFTVTNQSPTEPTTNPSVVRFYLSNDDKLDDQDKRIGRDQPVDGLAAGGRATVKLPVLKLPAGTAATGLYVFAVIDPDRKTVETDDGNNTVVYGPLP